MEKPEYRDNLEALLEFFGERRLVTAADVARYLGRSRKYVARIYGITPDGITLNTLARRMCD